MQFIEKLVKSQARTEVTNQRVMGQYCAMSHLLTGNKDHVNRRAVFHFKIKGSIVSDRPSDQDSPGSSWLWCNGFRHTQKESSDGGQFSGMTVMCPAIINICFPGRVKCCYIHPVIWLCLHHEEPLIRGNPKLWGWNIKASVCVETDRGEEETLCCESEAFSCWLKNSWKHKGAAVRS